MFNPEKWDIWYANFAFEDEPAKKDRPVLVLEMEGVYYVSAMITSHEKRDLWGEVDVSRWKSAGLDEPSTIRLSRVEELELSDFRRKAGRLAPEDVEKVKDKLY